MFHKIINEPVHASYSPLTISKSLRGRTARWSPGWNWRSSSPKVSSSTRIVERLQC